MNISSAETLAKVKRYDISRNLVCVWVEKYEAGGLHEDARAADLVQEYEARIAMNRRGILTPVGADRRATLTP